MKKLCDQTIFVTLEAEPHVEPEVVSSEPEPEPEAESINEASEPVEVPEVGAAQVEANGQPVYDCVDDMEVRFPDY